MPIRWRLQRFSGCRRSGGEGTGTRILGVAQGQFNTQAIMAKFAKDKTKADHAPQ
jgi:hypothetical protein